MLPPSSGRSSLVQDMPSNLKIEAEIFMSTYNNAWHQNSEGWNFDMTLMFLFEIPHISLVPSGDRNMMSICLSRGVKCA
jgi:hypothetical protein